MKCNHCGGDMVFKKDEDILIPVGNDESAEKAKETSEVKDE